MTLKGGDAAKIKRYKALMYTLAHISDVHLTPLSPPKLRELASKRITGYVNWRFNRASSMGDATLDALIVDLKAHAPDHIANTGDIINLGLNSEIATAKLWMQQLGAPENVSFVPGNHDAYVRGALDKMLDALGPYMQENPDLKTQTVRFPYCRIREKVALIGVNSAIATAPFIAAGRVKRAQADQLETILKEMGERGLCRVVMLHHPPVRGATKNRKRLYGIGHLQRAIKNAGAELVLHGHTHLPTLHHVEGANGQKVPVIGVPSASQAPRLSQDQAAKPVKRTRPPAAYNLFEIEQSKGSNYEITWITRGFAQQGSIIEELRRETL